MSDDKRRRPVSEKETIAQAEEVVATLKRLLREVEGMLRNMREGGAAKEEE